MIEIYSFPVYNGEAQACDTGLVVKLYLSEEMEIKKGRISSNIKYGISVLQNLLNTKRAQIADSDHPIRLPSGGAMFLLKEGMFVCHRRDRKAPTHKLYHSIPAGHPNMKEVSLLELAIRGETQESYLLETCLREGAEECVFVTRGNNKRLVVPKGLGDLEKYTIETAKKIGLGGLEKYEIGARLLNVLDKVEFYDSHGRPLCQENACVVFNYESETGITALQIIELDINSWEILPVDAEGKQSDGKFVRFNRESYILNPNNIGEFGSYLDNPDVNQVVIENGIPKGHRTGYEPPFLGMDLVEVKQPHLWAPDELLVRALDAIGVKGYAGKWMEIELWKYLKLQNHEQLVPAL